MTAPHPPRAARRSRTWRLQNDCRALAPRICSRPRPRPRGPWCWRCADGGASQTRSAPRALGLPRSRRLQGPSPSQARPPKRTAVAAEAPLTVERAGHGPPLDGQLAADASAAPEEAHRAAQTRREPCRPEALYAVGSAADLAQAWTDRADHGQGYQGLAGAPLDVQETAMGIRAGSLAARLVVEGLGLSRFPEWVHFLDAHFPMELGQINRSRTFAERFATALLQEASRSVVHHLHVRLRALGIPSDYVRVIDGITPSVGESLLIHVLVTIDRGEYHSLKWSLLDLTPQGKTGQSPPRPLEPVLGFHGLVRTVDKVHATERAHGIGDRDRRLRFAVSVGDGALEGPFGLGVGAESARRTGLPEDRGWGSVDSLHCLDKAGEYADMTERGPPGLVARFHKALQDARANFHFGNGRAVARAVAQRHRFPWRAPLAPRSQTTRMVIYESRRCPPNC